MTRLDEVRWADAGVGERQGLVSADVLGEPIMPAKRQELNELCALNRKLIS
jgi:hypothetical protein